MGAQNKKHAFRHVFYSNRVAFRRLLKMKSAWVRGAPEHFSLLIIYMTLLLSTTDSPYSVPIRHARFFLAAIQPAQLLHAVGFVSQFQ